MELQAETVYYIISIPITNSKIEKYKKLILTKNNMENFQSYFILLEKHFAALSEKKPSIFYSNWTYSSFHKLMGKKTGKNDFKLLSIEDLKEIPVLIFDNSNSNNTVKEDIDDDLNSKKKKKNIPKILDRTGLFLLEFSEKGQKEYVIYCCFLNSINERIYLYAALPSTVEKIKHFVNTEKAKQLKPNTGIFTGTVDQANVLHYIPFEKNISKKVIYHNTKKEISDDIEFFFGNVERSIKNGEKGTRKILIAGNQGTGKSSFINEIILKYKETHSILICTDLKMLVKHTQLCGKFSVPCFSILEDCENYLDDRDSNLLNYFSGALEPKNAGGSYIIMTTNYPQKLSDRIMHRPERVDEVFILSNLDDNEAIEVAKMYFSKYLPEEFNYETLRGLFKDATGAEIMKYADDIKKAADFKLGDFSLVDRKFMEFVMKHQKDKYAKLSKINTSKTNTAKAGRGYGESIGFGSLID